MMIGVETGSLLDYLRQMPDPRSRKGRTYPLWAILTMLVLAALHGERSLRGMWMWGSKHWSQLYTQLDLLGTPHPPAYSTVWEVMSRLDAQGLEDIVTRWVASWAHVHGVSVDGKTLCGSRRRGTEEAALQVVTAAGQDLQVVLGQTAVGTEGELESTIRLLRSLPLQGRVVTADAGLLHREVVETILEQGGEYLGVIKNNEPDVKEMMDDWIAPQIFPPEAGKASG
jgi:hypothetical protein